MQCRMVGQLLLGVEGLAAAGPHTGKGVVRVHVQPLVPAQVGVPLEGGLAAGPVAPVGTLIFVRLHVLGHVPVVVEGLAAAGPRAPELSVPFVSQSVLLQVVHVLGPELAVGPLAVVVAGVGLVMEAPVLVQKRLSGETLVALIALVWPDVEVHLVLVRFQVGRLAVRVLA